MAQTVMANSTKAGIVSYPMIAAALGAVLTILGITIPSLAIAIPLTAVTLTLTQATDVSIAAGLLSYVVVHFTPDSVQQQIANLAALAPKLLALIPKTYSAPTDFPNSPPQATPSNIKNAALAIAVIQDHIEKSNFPTGKNGA